MVSRLIIGDRGRSVNEAALTPFRFSQSDLAFEAVATYLTALHGFLTMTEVYKSGGAGVHPWAADDVALFDGAACNVRLEWSPHQTVAPMVHNAWPNAIGRLFGTSRE